MTVISLRKKNQRKLNGRMQDQRRHGLPGRRRSSSGSRHEAPTSLEASHEARGQAANASTPSNQGRGRGARPGSTLPDPNCGRPTSRPTAEDGSARLGLPLSV